MTEPRDYTDWTWEQHVQKATELAAKADQLGGSEILSQARERQNDVQQVTARGWLHAKLAELKKPEPEVTPTSGEVEAITDGAADGPSVEPVGEPTQRRTRQRGSKNGGA